MSMNAKEENDKTDWAKCVGPGWSDIVRPLVERCNDEGVRIVQVKEKFGGLRFYVDSAPRGSGLFDAIRKAEAKSFETCEECGKPGKQVSVRGWQRTRCEEHTPQDAVREE